MSRSRGGEQCVSVSAILSKVTWLDIDITGVFSDLLFVGISWMNIMNCITSNDWSK